MLFTNPTLKWRRENEDCVILKSGTVLNKTGGEILEYMQSPRQLEEILTEFQRKYEKIDPKVIANDIISYIDNLKKHYIILDTDTKYTEPPLPHSTPNYLKYISKYLGNQLKSPLGVALEITGNCNCRCMHCCVSANDAREAKRAELTTDQWRNVIEQLAQNEVFTCTFTGGEPLLREDLYELITYAKNLRLDTSLLTNGALLSPDKVKRLIDSGLDSIAISIDGMEKSHDEFRGSPGLFREIAKMIPFITSSSLKFGVVTVINKINYNDINNLLQYLDKEGVKSISLAYYRLSGRAVKNHQLVPTPKDYQFVINRLWEYEQQARKHIRIKYPNLPVLYYINSIGHEAFKRLFSEGRIGLCGAGVIGSVISPSGDLKPCDMSGEILCGNVLETPFKDIWLSAKPFQELRKLNSWNLSPCRDCQLYKDMLCYTGCKSMPYQFDSTMHHTGRADYIREECYRSNHCHSSAEVI